MPRRREIRRDHASSPRGREPRVCLCGVPQRHDHSFRIPSPDLSVKLGTPNACTDCHRDMPAAWAADAIESWHGPRRKGFQTYAEAFHAAWNDQADAAALLAVVASDRNAPAFARAGALSELASRLSPSNIGLARSALSDPDPMVRIAALEMLANVPGGELWPLISPLLSDPIRCHLAAQPSRARGDHRAHRDGSAVA